MPVYADNEGHENFLPDETPLLSLASLTESSVADFSSNNLVESMLVDQDETTPQSYKEAMQSSENGFWTEAIERELSAMEENNVYERVERRSATSKPINTRWVFTKKGDIYKARLVVRGFKEQMAHDLSEIYLPVPKLDTVRAVVSIANQYNYDICQLDVVAAFQHPAIQHNIFIEIPDGVDNDKERYVWRLQKLLYGLITAAKSWYDRVDSILKEFGLICLLTDPCIYISKDRKLVILVYVDDFLCLSQNSVLMAKVIDFLSKRVKIKVIGRPKKFLRIQFNFLSNGVILDQSKYIDATIRRFHTSGCNPLLVPMDSGTKICKNQGNQCAKPFRSLIGCLSYIAAGTRIDVAYAVNELS